MTLGLFVGAQDVLVVWIVCRGEIIFVHGLIVVVLEGFLLICCNLKIIDIPLHFLINFLIVVIPIIQTFQFFLRVLIKIPLPFFFFHLLLAFCQHFLLVFLIQIITNILLQLLPLTLLQHALVLQTLFGTLVRHPVKLQIILLIQEAFIVLSFDIFIMILIDQGIQVHLVIF